MSGAQAHIDAAIEAMKAGVLDRAIASFERAVAVEPTHPSAWRMLGEVLFRAGRGPDARRALERATSAAPSDAAAWFSLGAVLALTNQVPPAAEAFARAVALNPADPNAHALLGKMRQSMKLVDDAIESYRTAIALQPRHMEARVDLANCYLHVGDAELAIEQLSRVALEAPDHVAAHDCLCTAVNYPDSIDRARAFEVHQAYGRAVMRMPGITSDGPAPDLAPDRRLRVAYLSPDLCEHSVAYFALACIEARDRETFEVYAYNSGPFADAMSERIKRSCNTWRDVRPLSDQQLDRLIRQDRIDILVELSGHTWYSRLPALRARPASVQATYIGYPNTTGLPAIDERIVDHITDPPDSEMFHVEHLERLPGCFLCYTARDDAPEVAPPPSARTGIVTFGSFNAIKKVTPGVMEVWCRVLGAVPGSRLVLKHEAFSCRSTMERFEGHLRVHGVDRSRVDFLPRIPDKLGHLEAYRLIDIALDPFPYNGTTTTCEALWMGVPVVALEGRAHAGRVSMSLLHACGLDDLVARTPEEYVSIAAGRAADGAALARTRAEMRERVRRSALCDREAFSTGLEGAYRSMWRRACARGAAR